MKNKIYIAICVFMFVFCAPWALANAFQTYVSAGEFVGKFVYEVTHDG